MEGFVNHTTAFLALVLLAAPAAAGTVTVGENFTGSSLPRSGYIPPDTMGAVGPDTWWS